jgi:hypothetical protein
VHSSNLESFFHSLRWIEVRAIGPRPLAFRAVTAEHMSTPIPKIAPKAGNGGLAITGYTVQAYRNGVAVPGAQCRPTSLTEPLSCTVRGLTNYSSYTFRVTAFNEPGSGPAATGGPAVPKGPTVQITNAKKLAKKRAALKGETRAKSKKVYIYRAKRSGGVAQLGKVTRSKAHRFSASRLPMKGSTAFFCARAGTGMSDTVRVPSKRNSVRELPEVRGDIVRCPR